MQNKLNVTILAVAAIALAAQPASAQLRITEVMAQTSSGTSGDINGDWWELTNFRDSPVSLLDYRWADTEDALDGSAPSPNIFPDFTIAAGQSIVILDGNAASEDAWLSNWGLSSLVILSGGEMVDDGDADGDTFSGLSSGGDAVFFFDPSGVLLDSYLYDDSIFTRGTSFEADGYGADLGLSAIGENGAYQAANGDIGSPGVAVVPEPSVLALGGLAMAGTLLIRRRA